MEAYTTPRRKVKSHKKSVSKPANASGSGEPSPLENALETVSISSGVIEQDDQWSVEPAPGGAVGSPSASSDVSYLADNVEVNLLSSSGGISETEFVTTNYTLPDGGHIAARSSCFRESLEDTVVVPDPEEWSVHGVGGDAVDGDDREMVEPGDNMGAFVSIPSSPAVTYCEDMIPATGDVDQLLGRISDAQDDVFLPSAPALSESEWTSLDSPSGEYSPSLRLSPSRSSSQVSISEGPFFFEVERKSTTVYDLDPSIVPFTDAQLSEFYRNQLLDRLDQLVAEFVQGHCRPDEGEFHQLVAGFHDACAALALSNRHERRLTASADRHRVACWRLEPARAEAESQCQDGRSLLASHQFQRAVADTAALADLRKALQARRQHLQLSLTSHAHAVQLARLQVERYMSDLATRHSLERKVLHYSSSVSAESAPPDSVSVSQVACAGELRQCCSVLFAALRQCAGEPSSAAFVCQTRQWLLQTGGALIHMSISGTSADNHLNLLNQVLRCSSGMSEWAMPLLQPPPAGSPAGLDYLLAALYVIVSAVPGRAEFLRLPAATPAVVAAEAVDDEDWIVVDDEDKEQEKSEGFIKLQEKDLSVIFNQLPWKDTFRFLLGVSEKTDSSVVYDPRFSSEYHMLRLFAFASQIVKILASGLSSYCDASHSQFSKILCHQLLDTVHFVSDHWECYSDQSTDSIASRSRLLVEYDSFICRAASQLLTAPHLTAIWNFLANFPFHLLTTRAAWKLLWLMHTPGRSAAESTAASSPQKMPDVEKHHEEDVWAAEILSPIFHGMFQHQLVHMSQPQVYFRLSTLTSMAVARRSTERTFIKAVTRDLMQVCFVTPATRELCSKSGRDMLANVCNAHPFIMSYIMTLVQEHLCSLGRVALYLVSGLPWPLWRPTEGDLDVVCAWLTEHPLESVESQLGRRLLERLSWGLEPAAYDRQLCLPAELHRRAALAVVAAQAAFAAELPPARRGGLGSVVALVASAAELPSAHAHNWSWRMLARLRLHALDRDAQLARTVMSDPTRGLADVPSLTDPQLESLQAALRQEQPLASYAALLLSTLGHSLPQLCAEGLASVAALVAVGRPTVVVHLLELIVPLFLHAESKLCCEVFPPLLQVILAADQTYLKMMKTLVMKGQPGPLIQQMAGLIQFHLNKYQRYGLESPVKMVLLWLRCLTSVPTWFQDSELLYLLNHLLRAAFAHTQARQQGFAFVKKLISSCCGGSTARASGGLSSLFSWVSAGSLQPILPASSLPEVPWLAWFTLRAETQLERESGLWCDLIATLSEDRSIALDQALKRVCSQQRLPLKSAQCLAIYRWAQQALDTDLDCPLLPALWQQFFALYLAKVVDVDGRDQGSVGNRFFEGMVNLQYLKRLKRRLQETVEHCHSRAAAAKAKTQQDTIESASEFNQLTLISRLFVTYGLWLEEPRVSAPDVCLEALPPAYNATKLVALSDDCVWEEYICFPRVRQQDEECLNRWLSEHHGKRQAPTTASSTRADGRRKVARSPAQRICKRLSACSGRIGPPSLSRFHSPVPSVSIKLFVSATVAVDFLANSIDQMSKYASKVCLSTAELSSLECQRLELLPDLYTNPVTQVVKRVRCDQTARSAPEYGCSGPAAIVLQCDMARLNDTINFQLEENSQAADRILKSFMSDPPLSIGIASALLESFITSLVRRYREEQGSNANLQTIGSALFYRLVSSMTEETSECLPIHRLFSSSLHVLGKWFIREHRGECARLLDTVCARQELFELLLPHFAPLVAEPELYARMFRKVESFVLRCPEVAADLLKRFLVAVWLATNQPSLSHRSVLVSVVISCLSIVGHTPASSAHQDLLKLLCQHLLLLLRHDFPQHYGEILQQLLDSSRQNTLALEVWFDFINAFGGGSSATFNVDMEDDQRFHTLQVVLEAPPLLTTQELLDTCKMLTSRFLRERIESNCCGLYGQYAHYSLPLSIFLGVITSQAIVSVVHNDKGSLSDDLMRELWALVRDTFSPWVTPLFLSDAHVWQQCSVWLRDVSVNRQRHLLPWSATNSSEARCLVEMYVHVLVVLYNTLPASRCMLSHMWEHYCSVYGRASLTEHVLSVVHPALLKLPWPSFWPQMADVERMVALLDTYLPESHSFVAQVVVQLPWTELVEAHYWREMPSAAVRLHVCLITILVKVASEPKIRQSGELFLLLSRAESFSWHLLDADGYQRALNWYVMSCDPRAILETDDREPVDLALVGFLQVAAGHVADGVKTPHTYGHQKRCFFIRAVVRLLCAVAFKHKNMVKRSPRGFTRTLIRILRETQALLEKMPSVEQSDKELLPLVSEILHCCSSQAPSHLIELCLSCLVSWVEEETQPLLMRAMLNVCGPIFFAPVHLAEFMEALIEALFSKEQEFRWSDAIRLMEIPGKFEKELADVSVEGSRLLVLHALLLRRLTAESSASDLASVELAVGWLSRLPPLTEQQEMRLCPLLHQTLQLLVSCCGTAERHVARLACSLGSCLLAWGEDRDASGILGAIGFGRRSPLSLQFRLLCRIVSASVLSHISSSDAINRQARPSEPRWPCEQGSPTKESKWGLPDGLQPEAYQAFQRLVSLRGRRDCEPHLQAVEEAIADILSPSSVFASCQMAFAEAVNRSYYHRFLHLIPKPGTDIPTVDAVPQDVPSTPPRD